MLHSFLWRKKGLGRCEHTLHIHVCIHICANVSNIIVFFFPPDVLTRKDVINTIMIKELVVSGVMVYTFSDRFDQARKEMTQWIKEVSNLFY